MFGQILNAIQNQQKLKLGGRQQTLAEQQFSSEQQATKQHREDIAALDKYDVTNIDKAPAGVLARVDKTSAAQLLRMNQARQEGKPVKAPPADLVYFEAIEKEAAEKGIPLEQTNRWKFKFEGRGKKKTDQELKAGILDRLTKGFIITKNTPKEEVNTLVNERLAILKGEAETPKTGDPLLDSVFEDAMNQERKRHLDKIFFEGETPL